jgi:hypothetical protein
MMLNIHLEELAHIGLNFLKARVAELFYFTAIETNKVIVLFITVCAFELRLVFPELMFDDEVTSEEEIESIINRCSANAVFSVFHLDIQGFNVEMIVDTVYLFQDSEAFRSFSVPLFFQESEEDFPGLLGLLRIRHAQ